MADELRVEYDLKSLRVRKLGPVRKSFGSTVPKNFHGLLWEPSNEQEVVMLFGQLLDHLPRKIAVEFIQTPYPDCKAVDVEKVESIWIEFKLFSSDYSRPYKNALPRCDWIVCWQNDLGSDGLSSLPQIVSLKEIVDRLPQSYILNPRKNGETQEEYFRRRILGLSKQHQHVIQQLLEFGNSEGLSIEWPKTNGACFVVRDARFNYFKVTCNGMIGSRFFKRSVDSDLIKQLVQQLNEALQKEWFSVGGKRSFDIEQLMPNQDVVQRFIAVWQRFAARP
jgi:hypothetical protein